MERPKNKSFFCFIFSSFVFLSILTFLPSGECQIADFGCYSDRSVSNFSYQYVAANYSGITPSLCFLECLKIDAVEPGKGIIVGITSQTVCLCGFQFIDTEAELGTSFCTFVCNDTSACGGPNGAISVYKSFSIYATNNISLSARNYIGNFISEKLDPNTLMTGEVMYLDVTAGEHLCSSYVACTTAPAAGLRTCSKSSQSTNNNCMFSSTLPPLNITVDYGDGSGSYMWTKDDMRDVWSHVYSEPGLYTISVQFINIYSLIFLSATQQILVVDPALITDQSEVVCPDVVDPGSYFICKIDIPRGNGLRANIILADDVYTVNNISTGIMSVPDAFTVKPGGELRFKSYNPNPLFTTASANVTAFIVNASQFQYVTNISQIEFVPISTGSLIIEALKPVCPLKTNWCPLIGRCSKTCFSNLESLNGPNLSTYSCNVAPSTEFCSQEEMCHSAVVCPLSFAVSASVPPTSYAVVATLWSGSIATADLDMKKIIPIPKAVRPGNVNDYIQAYVGFKTNLEVPYIGNTFIGFRCPVPTSCVAIPYVSLPSSNAYGDSAAVFSAGTYTPSYQTTPSRKYAVRVRLQEDRILNIKKKFFCDRTTEKTMFLDIIDQLNNTVVRKTRRISCQYPVLWATDLTPDDMMNTNNNSWTLVQNFPTQQQIALGKQKLYKATLWARQNEQMQFHVLFPNGSHINITWNMSYTGYAGDSCLTTAATTTTALTGTLGALFVPSAGKPCQFPFRYDKILYYGCTNSTTFGDKLCAYNTDQDFNALQMAVCNANCHSQLARTNEDILAANEASDVEAFYQQDNQFYVSTATELVMARTFTTPGTTYKVTLVATNLNDETDVMTMVWEVLCSYPINPGDWSIMYPPYLRPNETLNVTFSIKPNVVLPARPTIRITKVNGMQRIDNDIGVDNATTILFAIPDSTPLPNCINDTDRCYMTYTLNNLGVNGVTSSGASGTLGPYGANFTISLPTIKGAGSHGFAVQFVNGISSIKVFPNNLTTYTETIQILDPGPVGTGEWVSISSTKWDLNWVEMFYKIEGPVQVVFNYLVPMTYGSQVFGSQFVTGTKKWYLPADAVPAFLVSIYTGTTRRIQYTFNNTAAGGYQPPPCFIDWPDGTYLTTVQWTISHCPNLTEDTYSVVASAWNPLDGWMSSKPTLIEILSSIGPITIDDFQTINDMNETKRFTISLEQAGRKTCIAVDYNDKTPIEYWGYAPSCQLRYPLLATSLVKPFDYNLKVFNCSHVYAKRGLYSMHVFGYDERYFSEAYLYVTIYRSNCMSPNVWIPNNQTSFAVWEAIPTMWKSKGFQIAAMASIVCNVTTPTYISWRVFSVALSNDPDSQVGKIETLTPIRINTTISTWNQAVLDVPPLLFPYNLYKFVFRFQVDTGTPFIPMFREAFTYINITKSNLQPVLIQGSVAKLTRGWGQLLSLNPQDLSSDPDNPTDSNFNYTWWCRVIYPIPVEVYPKIDSAGYPIYQDSDAQYIPRPGDPALINPGRGCFGLGPGPMKTRAGVLTLNTSSFVTYSKVYEIMLVLSKDTRRAKAIIQVDLGTIPAPIVSIDCANQGLCFPGYGGIWVNPTSRLAILGNCVSVCDGSMSYYWEMYEDPVSPWGPLNLTYCSSDVTLTSPLMAPTTASTAFISTSTVASQVGEYRSILMSDGVNTIASTKDVFDYTNTYFFSTDPDPGLGVVTTTLDLVAGVKRRKRAADLNIRSTIGPLGLPLPSGCSYVFADGSRDSRDGKQLAIQQMFFAQQRKNFTQFVIKLNVTKKIFDGRRYNYGSGINYLNVFINSPPNLGKCVIQVTSENGSWVNANSGRGLVDTFQIFCSAWRDPNGHAIVKYIFKIIEPTSQGNITTVVYSGPLPAAQVVLPVGQFDVYSEIYDEANAYAVYDINPQFLVYLPDQKAYNDFNVQAQISMYSKLGDQMRVAQLLLADASIRKSACWYNVTCAMAAQGLGYVNLSNYDQLQGATKDAVTGLLINITNANSDALAAAVDNMNFNSIDQLEQGASVLYAITSNALGTSAVTNTLDMRGRTEAVALIQSMATGFKSISVPDPNKLIPFIESVSGAVMSIMESLNSVLSSNDPSKIPLSDIEGAKDMPYDTYIPEGGGDIPDNPLDALKQNAYSLTRIQAVTQCKQMTDLVDQIAKTAINNSVVGEVIRTKAPNGVQMVMAKVDGSTTVGNDLNGDGYPDIPLRYTFDSSDSVVQFPLGFCPGVTDLSPHIKPVNCTGQWGIVLKEWQTITAIYPTTASNLNLVTKQVDVDVYSAAGDKMTIAGLWSNTSIQFLVGRMQSKNPSQVAIPNKGYTTVNATARLDILKRRKKQPIIYHFFNVTKNDAVIKVQIQPNYPDLSKSNMVILFSHSRLPTIKSCDKIKIVQNIETTETQAGPVETTTYFDWFLSKESVGGLTGKFYLGVASIVVPAGKTLRSLNISDETSCETSGIANMELAWNLDTTTYTILIYSSGLYYYDQPNQAWVSDGITIYNTTRILTAGGSTHLTSFATGFAPHPNTIDFNFIYAAPSFRDNMTIFMLIIFTFIVYLCMMIWAIIKDKKDLKAIPVPVMVDNHPEDKYMYEIVVETGPKDSHSTTATINFILSGTEEETDVRTLNDPERVLFKKGARDAFLCTVPRPLGELKYLRIWTDSCALGEMSAWYLMCISVHDVQTGKIIRFVADQWLAIDRGTYEDDITLAPQEEDEPFDSSYVFRSGGNRKLADDHLWWSVYSRPVRSRFTRCQRVSTCMALLYLCFLTNAMFYDSTSPRVTDPFFTIGPFGFDPQDIGVGFISNVIVFPPMLLIVFLFKKSKPLKKRRNRLDIGLEQAKDKGRFKYSLDEGHVKEPTEYDLKREKGWPPFCTIVGWIVCLLVILGGAFAVFSYGLQFGNDMTYQWVVSMLVSFFSSILITQPIKIAIIAFIIGYCCKKTDFDDDHVFQQEVLPTIFYDPENPPDISSRPKYKPRRRMLEPEFFDQLKTRKMTEQEMKELLRNLVVYFIYVIIIFIICYGNNDPNAFRIKAALEQSIIYGGTVCETVPDDDPAWQPCNQWGGVNIVPDPFVNFKRITNVNAWWAWINNTVITNVKVQDWYNGESPFGLRGYMNDRVNRLIGYAVVRQIREKPGSCKPPTVIRSAISSCTGENGISNEETSDFCRGWVPKTKDNKDSSNCTDTEEYTYRTASYLNTSTISAPIRSYSGGGYVLRLTGYKDILNATLITLKAEPWIDAGTRALILEFSVYNAQTNLFALIKCVAEFVGGGIRPWYRIDAVVLFNDYSGFNIIILVAEISFVVATFYYIINLMAVLKKQGCKEFWSNNWNLADVFTVLLSIAAVVLYAARLLVVMDCTKIISATGGNKYISLTSAFTVNAYYNYVISITVFTSTIKFSKFLSFHKAFMQIAATIRLCFSGLSTFVVEFSIVFIGFSMFFFFVLKDAMEDFRDFMHALENTLAMSIGKFNFASLKAADEMAAWIFFVFAIVVNMILINMMMAIINLSFEEIHNNNEQYKNKFELLEYIGRTSKEMMGLLIAEPIVPVYLDEVDPNERNRSSFDGDSEDDPNTDRVSKDFTEKTDMLLDYIERTYLADGFADSEEGRRIISKMNMAKHSHEPKDEKKVMEYGFDAIFQKEQ